MFVGMAQLEYGMNIGQMGGRHDQFIVACTIDGNVFVVMMQHVLVMGIGLYAAVILHFLGEGGDLVLSEAHGSWSYIWAGGEGR